MNPEAESIIDHLGGTSAVARLTSAPTSTVHSWKKNGIPASRLAHLRLVAKEMGKPLPGDELTPIPVCELCDEPLPDGAVPVCTEADCPVPAKKAA